MRRVNHKTALITGSGGLIGSEAVRFFAAKGFKIIGIDNNLRKYFFGPVGSITWNLRRLKKEVKNYTHFNIDIRNKKKIYDMLRKEKPDLIIHAAAQPSHDWAAKEPLTDFTVNALGTYILLEGVRNFCPESVFIFTSTNKVYGDNPNKLSLKELKTRYEILPTHHYYKGIDENMSLDHNTHSLMGVSKTAADLIVQEYGRYFGLKTVCFRCGCLTGPAHSAAKLHGFLAYLVAAIVNGFKYTIYGYKGKQVRDNLHSSDLVNGFYQYYLKPKSGQVYNMGGSRISNVSIVEAIEITEKISGKKLKVEYSPKNRIGDHMWYISDVSKFKKDYPNWEIKYNTDKILEELVRIKMVKI